MVIEPDPLKPIPKIRRVYRRKNCKAHRALEFSHELAPLCRNWVDVAVCAKDKLFRPGAQDWSNAALEPERDALRKCLLHKVEPNTCPAKINRFPHATPLKHPRDSTASQRHSSLDISKLRLTILLTMANNLSREKQIGVLKALVEGVSIRSIERMTGIHRDTVMRLGARVGEGCAALLDAKMVDLPCKRLELDELWAFVGKKQRRVNASDDASRVGDCWTYVAIDAETKAIPTFLVGKRNAENTNAFVADLASRLRGHVQVSTDGLRMYIDAIEAAFPGGVDYAQIVKEYEAEPTGPGRYSPPRVTATAKTPILGAPVEEYVSTSYAERSNLTFRMSMRRFTRLTNGHSKKLENHVAAVALHVAHYNFARIHSSIRCTPAMELGVERTVWSMGELLDAAEAAVGAP